MMPAQPAQQSDGLYVRTTLSCQDALERTLSALSDEGFRYLAEIDVNASLRSSLHQFMSHYRILGADAAPEEPPMPSGHAPMADMPLMAFEPDWGLALPCAVDVFVDPHTGETVVMAADPDTLILEYGQRNGVAAQNDAIRIKLEAALARLTVV